MLSTTHLQTFVAVVEAGSYSAAARSLHMTQPAVSQHIRTLENQLGQEIRLFRRVGQKMKLTQVGEELLAATRDLLALAERTEERIKAMRGQVSGRVVIGHTPGFGDHYLPPLLAQFLSLFPLVTIALLVAAGETLLDLISSYQIDMAFVDVVQQRRGLQAQLVSREEVLAIAPHSHHLLAQKTVLPAMLREEPLIVPPSDSTLRLSIEDALRRRGEPVAELQAVIETDNAQMVLQAVRSGIGVGFIPAAIQPPSGVDHLPVEGLRLAREWYIVRDRDRDAPRAAQELFNLIVSRQGLLLLGHEGAASASVVEH